MVIKRSIAWGMSLVLLSGLILVCLSVGESRAQERGVVVIANSDVPDQVLDRRTLAYIFLKKKTTWSNKEAIEVVALTGGPVHEQFLREYLGKTPEQYSSHWSRLVFTGTGSPPRLLNDEQQVVAYVASVKGAIGYVGSGVDISGVKRIKVES
jgi:ABC-type phosphate transport system substrate-binding protein